MTTSTHHRTGFTLVELLVVITIIGMLVALLLPAVGAARARMFQTQCANNMRQIGLAMMNAATAKGTLPGYIQPVQRDGANGKRYLVWDFDPMSTGLGGSAAFNSSGLTINDRLQSRISWAAMLLPRLDRNDIWERLTDSGFDGDPIRPVEVFICPVDSEAQSSPENAALSYVANTGAWDWDDGATSATTPANAFLTKASTPASPKGETLENGPFHNLTDGRATSKIEVNDGASTTIMLSENIHKDSSYSWLGVGANQMAEQHFGMVWVVNVTPSSGTPMNNYDQVGIGKEIVPPSSIRPWYARPASGHPVGSCNVVFLDGHATSITPEIDYTVYQQLLTSNGRKCEDPAMHRGMDTAALPATDPIKVFRLAPPVSESDISQ